MPLYASREWQSAKHVAEVKGSDFGGPINSLNSTEATVPHINTTLMPIRTSSARILHDANREAYTRRTKTADASMPNVNETAGSVIRHRSSVGESGISVGDV